MLKQEGVATQIIHTTLTEDDIIELVEARIKAEEIGLPIYFDKEKVNANISIDKVTI